MTHAMNWFLAAETVAAVGLAAGPVARWARNYVHRLAHPEVPGGSTPPGEPRLSASPEPVEPSPAPESAAGLREEEADTEAEWRPILRHLWLLGPLPQAALALVTCGGAAWWGARTGAQVQTATTLPVLALLGIAASADAVAHILPNRLLGCASVWLMLCGGGAIAMTPALAHDALRAVLCALGAGAISLLAALMRTGLGLGDVKLCAVIGLWLGWYGAMMPALGLWVGIMVGGIGALALLTLRRAGRKDPMAYGPYLILGSFMAWPLAVL